MKRALASCVSLLLSSIAWAQDAAKPGDKPGDKPAQPSEKQPETKPAQPAENLPAPASLFEKHIAAVGGMDALLAEKNRVVRAVFADSVRSAEGQLRVYRVSPDKYYSKVEVPGLTTRETWCNAEGSWVRDTNTGTARQSGDSLSEAKLQAEFLGEAGFKTRYKELATVARERLGEADVYVVLATPHEARPRRLYFDANTGLLAAIRLPGPSGPDSDTVTLYSDYKKFGDILHPTRAVSNVGKVQVAVVTFNKIESNLAVMPSIDPPDEIKAIK